MFLSPPQEGIWIALLPHKSIMNIVFTNMSILPLQTHTSTIAETIVVTLNRTIKQQMTGWLGVKFLYQQKLLQLKIVNWQMENKS